MNIRCVVFHHPGPSWKEGKDFREQDGVELHVGHYAQLLERGQLQQGGPFLDNSGGMMVAKEGLSRDALEAFAKEDPAVLTGLLTFHIKEWYVPMSA